MAFIALRRIRNASSYYLVESYRDENGRSRKRTLCYLGREQDQTDTLEKAIAHWERIRKAASLSLRSSPPHRRPAFRARVGKACRRVELLRHFTEQAARTEAARLERRRRFEVEAEARRRLAEEAEHWQAIERLRRFPSPENADAAKRAFRTLALRHHPDQGSSHEAFIRLKNAYDRAADNWRRQAA
jgi:hypothetical protein